MNAIARCFLFICLSMGSAGAVASETDSRGFSYFLGIGSQDIRYTENASAFPVRTEVDTHNPILVTGALYAFNQDNLFSIDAYTTFAPNTATERWVATRNPFYGQTLTDVEVQTNQFTLQENDTRIFFHHRIFDRLFLIGGCSLRSQTFKRFAFKAGADDAVNTIQGQVIEETSSEVLPRIGLALETEQIVERSSHFGIRAHVGRPVWREVTNTLLPNTTFDQTGGHDIALEARYSYALARTVHIGAWYQYLYSTRKGQHKCVTDPSPDAEGDVTNVCDVVDPAMTLGELPKSKLITNSIGFEALWKL